MAYRYFKDLSRRTVFNKVLVDKALNTAKNSKCYGYQCVLVSIVYKFFDKKSSATHGNNSVGSGFIN